MIPKPIAATWGKATREDHRTSQSRLEKTDSFDATGQGFTMRVVILLTGFEPFDNDAHNPSMRIAQALEGTRYGRIQVRSAILPVDGVRAPQHLERLLTSDVRAVVMLGLARGRTQVALERVALNWADYRIPDNNGYVRRGERLYPGGPDAHLSSLPLETIRIAWRESGLPGYVSDSAGLYLCNQVFYTVRQCRPSLPAGFIHLPSDETLALEKTEAFVPLEFQRRTVDVALNALATWLEKMALTQD
jgi:pyroglutamyl-peptidase